MNRDPRNPDSRYMVASGSTHEFHAKLRKTLALLMIELSGDGKAYFVVEGLCEWPCEFAELQSRQKYFYEEHTCPTNFIRIPLIATEGDTDPHGLFQHVESVWMTDEYEACRDDERDSYLLEAFPQVRA